MPLGVGIGIAIGIDPLNMEFLDGLFDLDPDSDHDPDPDSDPDPSGFRVS